MAHHAETVMFHDGRYTGGGDPFFDLSPRHGVIFQLARHLEERNAATTEDIGDLRDGASLTESQPFAGHPGAVAGSIERVVVDCCGRREV